MNSSIKSYSADSIIFKNVENANVLYLVNKGSIYLIKEDNGVIGQVILVQEKGIVGATMLFEDGKWPYTAVAKTDCEVVEIDKYQALQVIKSCPKWVDNIMQTLTSRWSSLLSYMDEHNIEDDSLNLKYSWNPEEEKKYKSILGI